MNFLKNIKELIEKYPPNYFIELFRRFIENMLSALKNSGNSSWRFLLIFPLVLCIIILQILLFIKSILKNIFDIISFILKFFRKLFVILLEELNFYWYKFKELTRKLIENLVLVNKKLIEYINYQLYKLFHNDKIFDFEFDNYNIWKLLLKVIFSIFSCLIWAIFSTMMSVILIIGTGIIIIPFIHQWFRKEILNLTTIDD